MSGRPPPPRVWALAVVTVAAGLAPAWAAPELRPPAEAAPPAGAASPPQEEPEPPPDEEHYLLRAEVGAEFDSNAHRAETWSGNPNPPRIVASTLERFVLAGSLSDVVAPGHAVAVSATAAAKIFNAADARNESVAIAQSSLAWQMALAARTRLTLSGAYYEAFQGATSDPIAAAERRDFRSLAPTAQLGGALGPTLSLAAGAGYRWLTFKPYRDFDFDGPTGTVALRWALPPDDGADWEAGIGATFEHRRFAGPARVRTCTPPPPDGVTCPGSDLRVDEFLVAHGELTRTGRVLIGAGYAFNWNGSNSFGETAFRHFIGLRFGAELPWGFFIAARADLLLAFYREGFVLGTTTAGMPFLSIEEENRSSVRADLSRDLGANMRLFARYTYYANAIGSDVGNYARHTMLLSVAFVFDK